MAYRPRSRSPRKPQLGGDWFCPSCHDHQFAKNACCRNCGMPRPADPSLCGPPDAATFLSNHIIDDQVLSRFLALDLQQQQVVIMRGTLNGARDPSAVLSSRISQVLQGATGGGPNAPMMGGGCGGMAGGCGGAGCDPMAMMQQMQQMMDMMQKMGAMPGMGGAANPAPRMQNPRQGDWFCQSCGDRQFAKNPICRQCGARKPTDGSENNPPDVEKFLAIHPNLESHAVMKFRMLDPASQVAVISRGSLNGAREPTAVLVARMKELQRGTMSPMGMSPMGTGVPGNRIQPSTSDWYCPNCYDLQFKNNNQCRICGTSREHGVKDITQLDPANFLRGHTIEPQAVMQFQNLPDDLKKVVMSGGSLHGARDPTAVLIDRMTKARAGHLGGYTASSMGGDWYCQNCGDHQLARNPLCRKCGITRPTDGSQYNPPDPMKFLANHPVEEHAKMRFLSLDPQSQAKIIGRGSLAGARDPTAVLLTRIKEVAPTASASPMMGGCPAMQGGMDMQNMMMQQMMTMMQQQGGSVI